MKFSVSVNEMRRVLGVCSLATAKPPHKLANAVKFSILNGEVSAKSTDGSVFAEIPLVDADVNGDNWETVLPVDKLSAMIRESGDGDFVEIARGDNGIDIWSNDGRWTIPHETREMPFQVIPDHSVCTLQAETVAKMVAWSEFVVAGSPDGAIAGVRIEIGDGAVKLTATDNRRMSMFETPCECNELDTLRVPMSLLKMALALKSDVQVIKEKNTVFFKSENGVVYGLEPEGRYPNTAQFWKLFKIDPGNKIAPENLASAVRSVSILSDVDTKRVSVHTDQSSIGVSAVSQLGKSESVCSSEPLKGAAIKGHYNGKYVEQAAFAMSRLGIESAEAGMLSDGVMFLRGGEFGHVVMGMKVTP